MKHLVRAAVIALLLLINAHARADATDDACKSADAAACLAAGTRHEAAHGNLEVAVGDYQRACDLGALRGCAELARLYDWGWEWAGVKRDIGRSLALYRKACDGGFASACDDLGLMLRSGEGVEHDQVEAIRLFRAACDGKAMHGCTSLGFVYQFGEGVARDVKRARALYLQACDGGDYQGCDNTALLDESETPPAHADALVFFERACALHSGLGCKRAGEAYRAAKQPKLAGQRFRAACLLHESDACATWCELNPGPGPCVDRVNR